MKKEIKQIVFRKGTDIIYDLKSLGLVSARDLLGFNEDNIDEVMQKHSEVYMKVRIQESAAVYECDKKDVEMDELKDEADFVFEEVQLKIREGKYPVDFKVTDKSVKSVALTSKEYKEAKKRQHNAKREFIKLKRNKAYIHDMVKALEHKKDLLVSGSANYRAELEHELGNMRKKIR